MKANISTSLLPTSCAITGTRPSRVPLHLVQPVHRGSVAATQRRMRRRRQSPARRRTSRSTGSVPGSTGAHRRPAASARPSPGLRASRTRRASRTPCRSAGARARAGSPSARPARAAAAPMRDAQFLVQLAPQRLLDRLAGLELAAGKLPVAGVDLALGPRGEQEAAVARRSARRPRRRPDARCARDVHRRVAHAWRLRRSPWRTGRPRGPSASRAPAPRPATPGAPRRSRRRRRRSRAATAATIARYSSWLNG